MSKLNEMKPMRYVVRETIVVERLVEAPAPVPEIAVEAYLRMWPDMRERLFDFLADADLKITVTPDTEARTDEALAQVVVALPEDTGQAAQTLDVPDGYLWLTKEGC